jgi:hypothetical protein
MNEDNESLWFSQQRIFRSAIHGFTPSTTKSEGQALFFILRTYWPILRMNAQLFIDLVACLKMWWQWQNPSSESKYASLLLLWSIEAHTKLQVPHTDSLLASVLLGADVSRLTSLDNLYDAWFLPLTKALNHINNYGDNIMLKTTFRYLQGGNEQKILSNILDLAALPAVEENPLPMVIFIHHVLSRSQTSPLTFLSSLLVRGDSLDVATVVSNNNGDWVDDESDHEDEDSGTDLPKPGLKRPRPTTKHSKKELLTIVKLDKLYQERIQQMKQDCVIDLPVKKLAKKIVNANWLVWGLKLLDDPSSTIFYIDSLSLLLQSSSSFRPSMKVGVLSKLAFSKQILEKLWHNLQSSSPTEGARIVFCELFSHYLVPLSDSDFLKYHTEYGDGCTGLLAKDVVVCLNEMLYDVYWTKPVLAAEIQSGNSRARFLLAGTKLWNSLYERWNRLVRHPFCDEATWWFPHLASREGDGAVIPNRDQQHQQDNDDDDDSMDVESDEDGVEDMQVSTVEAETDALADSFQDPKMARVLTCIPQALPFERRVKLFHSLLKADKRKFLQAAASRRAMAVMRRQQLEEEDLWFDSGIREKVQIRRAVLYDDSMEKLNSLGPKLKHKIQSKLL